MQSDKKKKEKKKRLSDIIRRLGPGLITGASDDDPSGIATYAQAGAGFGPAFLWTALFTWPLMVNMQRMCARIGMVTRKGLMAVIRQYYPNWVSWMILLLSVPSIILNISADLAAVGAVGNMLVPNIPPFMFSALGSILLLYAMVKWNYQRIFRVLKWLCLALFCYLIIPFITETDWERALRNTILPVFEWKSEYILMLTGILGTTISPYLFFWQSNMEVEELRKKHLPQGRKSFALMDRDVRMGMLLSNLTFFFIILTSATVLNREGIKEINTVADAAQALQPLAGDAAYLLFAIGVIGTGALAIPVLAATLAYMASETFEWNEGLNKRYHQAPKFYKVIIASVIIALLVQLTGFSAVQLLLWTAVFYGVVSPPLIAIILFIANNKDIMNGHENSRAMNIWGFITLALMSGCVVLLLSFIM
jgi:NRAMP (natural resistance-associated macrophage protein)-like metal ion transporter